MRIITLTLKARGFREPDAAIAGKKVQWHKRVGNYRLVSVVGILTYLGDNSGARSKRAHLARVISDL